MYVCSISAGKYKKVMLTSVVDKERNVEKYIVRNLDVSVFETWVLLHFWSFNLWLFQ